MLIGLHGKSRSGKNTVANILIKEFKFKEKAFADNLRHILIELNPILKEIDMHLADAVNQYGWDWVKENSYTSVEMMIVLGQTARILDPDIWVKNVMKDLHIKNRQNYVITDCRQQNEVDALTQRGAYFWLIEKPGTISRSMDNLLPDMNWNHTIINDGNIDDLRIKVIDAYKELKKRITNDTQVRYIQRREFEDPNWKRVNHLKTRYKMTVEDYDLMLEKQNNTCALCLKKPQELLVIDHDHACCPGMKTCGNCIRGLLCTPCNMWMGVVDKDPQWLQRAKNWKISNDSRVTTGWVPKRK